MMNSQRIDSEKINLIEEGKKKKRNKIKKQVLTKLLKTMKLLTTV